MKKIIGILGVAVFSMAMFFNVNTLNSSAGDLDLASLISLNTANAEDGGGCAMTQSCNGGMCSVLNAKKRFLANGCKKKCNYTCTVQAWLIPGL